MSIHEQTRMTCTSSAEQQQQAIDRIWRNANRAAGRALVRLPVNTPDTKKLLSAAGAIDGMHAAISTGALPIIDWRILDQLCRQIEFCWRNRRWQELPPSTWESVGSTYKLEFKEKP